MVLKERERGTSSVPKLLDHRHGKVGFEDAGGFFFILLQRVSRKEDIEGVG